MGVCKDVIHSHPVPVGKKSLSQRGATRGHRPVPRGGRRGQHSKAWYADGCGFTETHLGSLLCITEGGGAPFVGKTTRAPADTQATEPSTYTILYYSTIHHIIV